MTKARHTARRRRRALLVVAALGLWAGAERPAAAAEARFAHIIVIIEENHGYSQIIGDPRAPNINKLAQEGGVAAKFYAETHPSEPNYVAILGGSTFGITDDDAWFCAAGSADPACPHAQRDGYANHTVTAPSLMDQLAEHRLTWKGYFESLPSPGSKLVYSTGSGGQPDQLYGAKHNGFLNFAGVQKARDLASRIVGFDQLARDLTSGDMPSYAHVIPNQCNDMHGLEGPNVPPDCTYDNDSGLIARGDVAVGDLIARIKASPIWSAAENTAIVLTWDEDDGPHSSTPPDVAQGCCGFEPGSKANAGGGHISTIVLTNHGPRGVSDDTPYNHYSLLRTTEEAFGISDYLGGAGDVAHGVAPMKKLFWK